MVCGDRPVRRHPTGPANRLPTALPDRNPERVGRRASDPHGISGWGGAGVEPAGFGRREAAPRRRRTTRPTPPTTPVPATRPSCAHGTTGDSMMLSGATPVPTQPMARPAPMPTRVATTPMNVASIQISILIWRRRAPTARSITSSRRRSRVDSASVPARPMNPTPSAPASITPITRSATSATVSRRLAYSSGVSTYTSLNWRATNRTPRCTHLASTPGRRSTAASSKVPSASIDSADARSTITPPKSAVLEIAHDDRESQLTARGGTHRHRIVQADAQSLGGALGHHHAGFAVLRRSRGHPQVRHPVGRTEGRRHGARLGAAGAGHRAVQGDHLGDLADHAGVVAEEPLERRRRHPHQAAALHVEVGPAGRPDLLVDRASGRRPHRRHHGHEREPDHQRRRRACGPRRLTAGVADPQPGADARPPHQPAAQAGQRHDHPARQQRQAHEPHHQAGPHPRAGPPRQAAVGHRRAPRPRPRTPGPGRRAAAGHGSSGRRRRGCRTGRPSG